MDTAHKSMGDVPRVLADALKALGQFTHIPFCPIIRTWLRTEDGIKEHPICIKIMNDRCESHRAVNAIQ